MTRFIFWAFTVGIAIGIGPKLLTATAAMAFAHQNRKINFIVSIGFSALFLLI